MSIAQSEINLQRYSRLVAKARPMIINTEEENNRMLVIVEQLIKKNDKLTKEEGKLLELLGSLISDFEEKHYPVRKATPLEMLHHLMDARDLKPKDLWNVFGSKGVASEVLNGKRSISKSHIKKLAEFFNVSSELFI